MVSDDVRLSATFIDKTPSPVMVELAGVSLSLAGERLLRDVHLAVGRGEVVALMGPSGEGKSLLLKIIAGLIEPTAGKVAVHGRIRSELTEKERLKLGRETGMLFQRNALFDSLTALENVSFPQIETLGRSVETSNVLSHALLEAVGLASAAERYPIEISGGMQKRLGIARALALKPKLILYDDPTAGLDPITSRKIIRLIKDLQDRDNATVIFVTNEISRAFQIADRVGFIFKGELVITGTVAETKAHADPRVAKFLRGQSDFQTDVQAKGTA
jgi:phospholipid/cholesterol/gamma-HCH transport system ATP-binding protein